MEHLNANTKPGEQPVENSSHLNAQARGVLGALAHREELARVVRKQLGLLRDLQTVTGGERLAAAIEEGEAALDWGGQG